MMLIERKSSTDSIINDKHQSTATSRLYDVLLTHYHYHIIIIIITIVIIMIVIAIVTITMIIIR